MRLFVSIDLPRSLAEAVVDVQERLADADGLRFVDPENAHVTLKFLGETAERRVPVVEDAVEDAVDDAGVDPFEATVAGLGVFPSLDYISVVWAGVTDGSRETTRLHEAVERETTRRGFEAASNDFTPHVTLARMDDARGKELVQRVVRESSESSPRIGWFEVDQLRLKRSTLTDDGPRYETVRRFAL
jgi:2'-5' RNA ligase